ncbi:hypothetical protein [Halomonas elongata]|uniref:Uncharacterized protein n=1 Tax=Halomonas elongata (strain ATCC 33173 / DSM 2581 / NBRC 15536 / NCIMB 2198 / 1H9) TaxID=768066 RepID=E1VAA5_HALED|nr:hypothetical protein [Halomonas elongata]RAW05945.1 hypothetical protein DKQ62_16505 [Halomonas elongata]WBF19195.1 hypothetical protein LM502_05770 [Halomonas elongata]WPU48055.1 hypothetical protein SR933_03995 [Halomonas elongata DSM 2581]CBV41951.1 uncharacterized protein HELO_2067 [Halomonas elongata DSM 2581]
MTIDTTIDQYRETKERMQSIIDQHMSAAFDELKEEFGATPTSVMLNIVESHPLGDKYPNGVYAGSRIGLGGE